MSDEKSLQTEQTNNESKQTGKREWSAPKVVRRASVDRTQGGTVLKNSEDFAYRPS